MLYKYRDFSKRTNEIITTKKIWLATPSTLNDPLECRPPIFSEKEINHYIEETYTYQLMGFIDQIRHCQKNGEHFFGLSGKDLSKLLKRIQKKDDLHRKLRVAHEFMIDVGATGFSDPKGKVISIQDTLSNVGIFSLSEDPLNTLLWSHYSKNHTGVALGFEEDFKLNDEKYCTRVKYLDTLPRLNLNQFGRMQLTIYAGDRRPENKVTFEDQSIRSILSTKTLDWSYEKEWRYFEKKSGLYDFPGKLSEVVFGVNSDKKDVEAFTKLCEDNIENKITFKKCFYGKNSSKIEIKKIN
ncbi:MAG: DUF2971 domain-containing protein [Pantoea sp.]|uniref:DUF2971 domain-containing protein n=1 Tax=Pantoea sp. TaxID=69393 RepID=UPI002387E471|nr:DUF2971 domain-containing protein [Pantoea sp.]MDE1190148.1 DUF2971 domain-containing protein [Pantoea sp.]